MDGANQTAPLPGWYEDPWNAGQRRYWDGQTWTGHVYSGRWTMPEARIWSPSGYDALQGEEEAAATEEYIAPAPAPEIPLPPPPPSPAPPVPPAEPARSGLGRWVPVLLVLAVVVGLAGGFGAVYAATGGFHRHNKLRLSTPATTTPTAPRLLPPSLGTGNGVQPSPSGDPAAKTLSDLVVRQSDVASNVTVEPIVGGNLVSGAATLDICNGTFPSEANRTARLQVVATSDQGELLLSTEAVAYDKPASTAQAFDELKSVAAKCPTTPVVSPVSEPTVTTKVNAAPDGAWPKVATVDRLAFDLTTTDEQGQTQRTIAVYLHRGRILIGVYFANPDGTQPAVNGQTSLPGIVNVFATRLAQLPANIVNG